MGRTRRLVSLTILASSSICSLALAEVPRAGRPPAVLASGSIGLVTDYRFRGLSASDHDPALQGTLKVRHRSGAYLSAWASSIDDGTGLGSAEVDLVAGHLLDVTTDMQLDLNGTYYLYPGARDGVPADVVEGGAKITRRFGTAELAAGLAYAPPQASLGGRDNTYAYLDAAVPLQIAPALARVHAGYTSGAWAPTGPYLDWSVGLDFSAAPSSWSIALVGTTADSNLGRSAIVASVNLSF